MEEPIYYHGSATFNYHRLPGVVTTDQAEGALRPLPDAEVPGLFHAQCPVCHGELRCKPLPGRLTDLFCSSGCAPAVVGAAVAEPKRAAA
jgi:hypothetical protein